MIEIQNGRHETGRRLFFTFLFESSEFVLEFGLNLVPRRQRVYGPVRIAAPFKTRSETSHAAV